MRPFELEAQGPFSLAESARFASRFTPTAHSIQPDGDGLRLAFVPDGEDQAAAVTVRQHGDGVAGEASSEAAVEQLRRILGVDVDGTGFAEVCERDPVVGELAARWPGFRPVGFPSPFEAGAWFLMSTRNRFRHALSIKERLASELGEEAGGLHAFPSPRVIAELQDVPGASAVRVERARALAGAALEGRLHGERLRALGPEAAVEELKQLPGVGPFTAQGIVVRGANEPDWLPTAEPRLAEAIEGAYGPGRDLAELAEGWRPYRTWVTVLLRRSIG